MHARIFDRDSLRTTSDLAEIRAALADRLPTWIELDAKSPETDELLAGALHLHALTIEDIWSTLPAPKLEDYDEYLYVIVHGIKGGKPHALEIAEVDVVIGQTFVVTHDPTRLICDDLAKELERSPRLLQKGPAWLAHSAIDSAVDRYLPVLDDLDREIEALEDRVLHDAGTRRGPNVLRRILGFKRTLLDLRRMAVHQREILLRLARGEFDEIPREVVPFYRDVYDHFLRVSDLVESYRDLVSSALEAYLSVQSNRMNEVMKTLTLISTVMLPITFIAGVYGMNFEHMPELHWIGGYPYVLGLMAVVTIAILAWFWRKGWLGGGDSMDVE
jgi:magnesium transporter